MGEIELLKNCVEGKTDEIGCYASIIEYNNFYEWLDSSFKKDNDKIRENELTYLYSSFDKIGNMLLNLNDSSTNTEKVVKLEKIDSINKNSFKDVLDCIKCEYEFLSDTNSRGYRHYTGLASWYVLSLNYLNEVIEYLSKD